MESLTTPGRATRLVVTLLGAVLLLAGTVWGDDDHFPFGPFRMYASAVDPDAPAADTRVEATDELGNTVLITPDNTGIRRAEFEGQLGRFTADPALLRVVLDAYARRNPDAPELREVQIVIRWHEVRDSRRTGVWRDEVVTSWAP